MYLHDSINGRVSDIRRHYDHGFVATDDYAKTLPDIMATGGVPAAPVPIQQVGVSNFRLPLKYRSATGRRMELETSITGSVSLAGHLRGIHMGRIVRLFYAQQKRVMTFAALRRILSSYLSKLRTSEARLKLSFAYPRSQRALRSRLVGYQYHTAAMEATLDAKGCYRRFLEFDFVYSSACPCSAELAEHARETRGIYAVPHSQRSKARVSVELAEGVDLGFDDLHQHCLKALKTETQVMVKRVDEQAFAEMNGAYLKFAEDAARLLYVEFAADPRIADFQVACSHLESLHSHDAVSVIAKGIKGGFSAKIDGFGALIC